MKYKSKNKYFQMPIKIDVHMRKQLIKTRKKNMSSLASKLEMHTL